MKKRYIQILISICEIRQLYFRFSFSRGVFRPSFTGDLSLVRYVWDVFHVHLGRTFVFGLRTKKTLKTFKKTQEKPKYLKTF